MNVLMYEEKKIRSFTVMMNFNTNVSDTEVTMWLMTCPFQILSFLFMDKRLSSQDYISKTWPSFSHWETLKESSAK